MPKPTAAHYDDQGHKLKWCSTGKHWLLPTLENFSPSDRTRDGLRHTCRKCAVKMSHNGLVRRKALSAPRTGDCTPEDPYQTDDPQALEPKADEAIDRLYKLYGRTSHNAELLDQVIRYVGALQAKLFEYEVKQA